jgi:transposase
MKPYSLDLRERVIAALEEGDLTQLAVAEKYDISLRTVETWARQWRETGNLEPKPHHSGPVRTLQSQEDTIRRELATQPDLTLEELCALVAAKTNVHASASMMCRELQILNLPRKKSVTRQSTRNAARPKPTRRASGQDRDDPALHCRTSQIHR